MDVAKIRASVAATKTLVNDLVTMEAKVLVDPKTDATAKLAAARGLNVLGRINSIVTTTEERIEKALKRLAPRVKKEKKAKK